MNTFEKILYFLQGEMEEPVSFGWFHIMWIVLSVAVIIVLFNLKNKYSEKQLKLVLGIYGVVALLLEITKQFIWTFNYDPATNIVTWDYEWYAFPFQLCTTPIFVSIICFFLKDNKIRNNLLSYMAYITIIGGFVTILLPDSCFVNDILINVHTMWLHCGSFVVSVYLLMSGTVKINKENIKRAFMIFLIFVSIASFLNIFIYNIDILKDETFNMFYISPYFISTLPLFDVIQENTPYIIFLLTYILAIFLGSLIIYYIAYGLKCINNNLKKK